jgi:hypothetical protein
MGKIDDSMKIASSRPRCWDWMVTSGSVQYARDRSAFEAYTPATGTVGGTAYIGIGRVKLSVRRSPNMDSTYRSLVLENVVHIPTAICNGFVPHLCSDVRDTMSMRREGIFATSNPDGKPAWYAENAYDLYRLVHEGNPQGESPLEDSSGPKMLSVHASQKEMEDLAKHISELQQVSSV